MIKIRLAIVDEDITYAERISFSLNAKYENNIEVYIFNSVEKLNQNAGDIKVDVVLIDESFDATEVKLKNVSVGYLCASNDISTIKGLKAVSKFQKIDDFHKDLLNLYSENMNSNIELGYSDEKKAAILFTSPAGGVGCSTLAVSYATRLAKQGKKPLYLNLQIFGDTSLYFTSQGNSDFSDIIYALKSKKANLPIKIQSCLKISKEGVYFFDSCGMALDMLEMSISEYSSLIETLRSTLDIDVVVIDSNFAMTDRDLLLMKNAYSIVLVSDGSLTANTKVDRMLKSLSVYDKSSNSNYSGKIKLFYNKFSSKTSKQMEEVSYIGGVQKYEGFPIGEIINRISSMEVLDKI